MEPVSRQEIVMLFNEWQERLEDAIEMKEGSALSETTRVVLSYAWILWTHSPDALTPEMAARMKNSFTEALNSVEEAMEKGNVRDGCYDLYRLYIQSRLEEVKLMTKASGRGPLKERWSMVRKGRFEASEIIIGAVIIVLIIGSAVLVFALFHAFSDYPVQLNVIFSIVVITLICVLLRVFKPNIVREALKIYKEVAKRVTNEKAEGK